MTQDIVFVSMPANRMHNERLPVYSEGFLRLIDKKSPYAIVTGGTPAEIEFIQEQLSASRGEEISTPYIAENGGYIRDFAGNEKLLGVKYPELAEKLWPESEKTGAFQLFSQLNKFDLAEALGIPESQAELALNRKASDVFLPNASDPNHEKQTAIAEKYGLTCHYGPVHLSVTKNASKATALDEMLASATQTYGAIRTHAITSIPGDAGWAAKLDEQYALEKHAPFPDLVKGKFVAPEATLYY